MSTLAQGQMRSTAFEHRMVVNGPVVAAIPQPVPQALPPKAVPVSRPLRVPQTANMIAMFMIAMAIVALGMGYLNCCAGVAHEQYRRARLQSILRCERDAADRLLEQQCSVATPQITEQAASALGMAPAPEQFSISIR